MGDTDVNYPETRIGNVLTRGGTFHQHRNAGLLEGLNGERGGGVRGIQWGI